MSKNYTKLLAMLISSVLVIVLVTGCGKPGYTESTIYSEIEVPMDDEEQANEEQNKQNGSDTGSGSKTGNGNNQSQTNNSNGNSKNSTKINTTKEGKQFLVNPEDYRGTTVKFVTWKDPKSNEDGPVIEQFEKKYGIKVEVQLVEQWGYVKTIATSIASGKQGDIFFENQDFPGSLTVMQPLDAAKINYNDPIWNKNVIKRSTIDGHPYLIDAISNIWTEVDMCVYNKKIFEDNRIPNPEEYYKNGKWTFAAFRKCAQDVSSIGPEYIGAEAVGEVALAAAGCSIYKFNNGKMSVGVDNKTYDVMTFLSKMHDEGLLVEGRSKFSEGKAGMTLTNAFALKKTGYYGNLNPDHLGVTYLPKWSESDSTPVSGIYRGWGLIRGCKNPVGAGIFLREYLDVNNYNLDNTFMSSELANFFFKITGEQSTNQNMINYYTQGMVQATGMGEEYSIKWKWFSESQIKSEIQKDINVMNNMCTKINQTIDKERQWLKETYK